MSKLRFAEDTTIYFSITSKPLRIPISRVKNDLMFVNCTASLFCSYVFSMPAAEPLLIEARIRKQARLCSQRLSNRGSKFNWQRPHDPDLAPRSCVNRRQTHDIQLYYCEKHPVKNISYKSRVTAIKWQKSRRYENRLICEVSSSKNVQIVVTSPLSASWLRFWDLGHKLRHLMLWCEQNLYGRFCFEYGKRKVENNDKLMRQNSVCKSENFCIDSMSGCMSTVYNAVCNEDTTAYKGMSSLMRACDDNWYFINRKTSQSNLNMRFL